MSTRAVRRAGLGIGSFAARLLAGLLLFVTVTVAAVMEASTPGELDPQATVHVLAGLVLILGLILALAASRRDIAGPCQRDRRRVFSVLRLVFDACMGIVRLLMLAGTVMQG